MTELERCDDEIRQAEVALRGGHPDLEGLLLALVDWRTERRLLIAEAETENRLSRMQAGTPGTRGRLRYPQPSSCRPPGGNTFVAAKFD